MRALKCVKACCRMLENSFIYVFENPNNALGNFTNNTFSSKKLEIFPPSGCPPRVN